jgi:hypothetical protein
MPKLSTIFAMAFACTAGLFASVQNIEAQTSAPATAAKPAATSEPRRMFYVLENGKFQSEFDSLKEVMEKSRGNTQNQFARAETELVSLITRCNKSAKTSYAMHRLVFFGIDAPVKSYFDFVATLPKTGLAANPERKKREQAMVDEVQGILSKSVFPRKSECDAIPMLLSVGNYDSILLETDDAQNPLVGTKINDGMMYSAITDGNEFVEAIAAQAKDPNFIERYGYNRYGSAQDAINAARLNGTDSDVAIFDGTKISLYRLGAFKIDYSKSGAAFDAQFDVFKSAKLRKGLTIVAVVVGRDKAVKINVPQGAKAK